MTRSRAGFVMTDRSMLRRVRREIPPVLHGLLLNLIAECDHRTEEVRAGSLSDLAETLNYRRPETLRMHLVELMKRGLIQWTGASNHHEDSVVRVVNYGEWTRSTGAESAPATVSGDVTGALTGALSGAESAPAHGTSPAASRTRSRRSRRSTSTPPGVSSHSTDLEQRQDPNEWRIPGVDDEEVRRLCDLHADLVASDRSPRPTIDARAMNVTARLFYDWGAEEVEAVIRFVTADPYFGARTMTMAKLSRCFPEARKRMLATGRAEHDPRLDLPSPDEVLGGGVLATTNEEATT